MNLLFYVLFIFGFIAKSDEISKKEIKFPASYGLLTAFGDFNSDKLTDVFVIHVSGRSFQILRQYEPGNKPEIRPEHNWQCACDPKEIIVGLIPSDFNGDAILDVVVVTKPREPHYLLRLLTGSLNGTIRCQALSEKPFAVVKTQPLVLDLNSDMISDLFAEDGEGKRKYWLGSASGEFEETNFPYLPFEKKAFLEEHEEKHKSLWIDNRLSESKPSAFIDLNGDFVADLFVDGSKHMEYWFAEKKGYFVPHIVKLPEGYSSYGASSFCDINTDAKIDHLLPVCSNSDCYIVALKNYSKPEWERVTDRLVINDISYKFIHPKYFEDNVELPSTVRVGDINGDGFPDLITLMRSSNVGPASIVLFMNSKCDDCKNNTFGRHFEPILYANQSISSDPRIVAFFDLSEDGKLDVIYSGLTTVNASKEVSSSKKERKDLQVAVVLNDEMSEANFLKVLVTSGLCLDNSCYEENFFQRGYRVPYGTNKAGPTVCYQLVDANGYEMKSCAGQLPQSSNFALQLPYCLFGLGPDANYIDHVVVAFPTGNTSDIFKRDEELIVPDSQIVVIPHPIDQPSQWIIQLFVTPSDIIYKTLYTFLGICGALVVIIGILHRKEQLKDLAEQEQYRTAWPDRRR